MLLVSSVEAGFAKDDVVVQLTASKVTPGANGKEKLGAAEQAKPGDTIEYAAVYRNESAKEVTKLEATVPIPTGLELLPGSSKPDGALASTDSKIFAAMPLMAKEPGAEKAEPVPLSQYRALRWTIAKLAPGASVTVSLRARVLTNLPTKTKP